MGAMLVTRWFGCVGCVGFAVSVFIWWFFGFVVGVLRRVCWLIVLVFVVLFY